MKLNDFYRRYSDDPIDCVEGVIQEYKYSRRQCSYFVNEYMAIHSGNRIELYEYVNVLTGYSLLDVIEVKEGE